jgi:hypothetical protein
VLGKGDPGHRHAALGVLQRVPVLDLDPQHELARRVEGPDVGALEVLLLTDPPHPGRELVAAPAPQALAEDVRPLFVYRIARGPHESLNRLRVPGAHEVDAVCSLGERLLDHPGPGEHAIGVEPEERQHHDHGGRAVAARRWPPLDEPPHELT